MGKFKVVITDQVFPTTDIEHALLGEIDATLEVADGSLEDVLARGRDADALLTTYFPITAETVSELSRCRIIARYGIGVDNVDIAAANAAGIVVTNVPDYSVEEVAAHALAMLLSALRKLPEADSFVRSGGWSIDPLRPLRRLSTLTVGLVGYGRISRRLAESLTTLGMDVICHDPYIQPAEGIPPLMDLDELLAASDAVSLHAPLTPGTRGMIGAEQLARMRSDAVLVNTSRGPLIVLEDLIEALRAGEIRAAALDVFEQEPLDATRLEGVPGLTVSPHMAYYSEEALQESQRKASTQIVKVLSGNQPDYPVAPLP
jgi:D-3-phosphoglycerate dehydrogenase